MANALDPSTIASVELGTSSLRGGETRLSYPAGKIRARRLWPGAVCVCAYVALAALEFRHLGELGSGHMDDIGSIDLIVQLWWLAWAAMAAPHVHSMFLPLWQNAPYGQNFGVNGSVLAVGTLFLPVTKLFGPVVTWNIVIRLSPVISATSMCFVLRRWTRWWPAAFVGGMIYGFSSYAFWYRGYIFLVFVPLPPIALLLLHEMFVRQRWRPDLTGALFAVVCALQYFVWTEVLASTIIMGGIAVLLFAVTDPQRLRAGWRYCMKAVAWGVGVGTVLLAYPVIFTFTGPQHTNGPPASASSLSFAAPDLLSAVVPTGRWLNPSTIHVPANALAFGTPLYVGLPMLLVLVCFAIGFRRRREILFAGAMAAVAFILSLGPRLHVDGHVIAPLPFAVFTHLPVVEGLLSNRLSLYTTLFMSALFAIGLDEFHLRLRAHPPGTVPPERRVAHLGSVLPLAATVGITAMAVLPFWPDHVPPVTATSSPNVPSFFTSSAVRLVPRNSVVLAYPYPDEETTNFINFHLGQSILLDQAISGMRFRVIGGYGWFPSPNGRNGTIDPAVLTPKSVRDLFDAAYLGVSTVSSDPASQQQFASQFRAFLDKYDVQTVMVLHQGKRPDIALHQVAAVIGSPSEVGGVSIWLGVQQRLRSP